MSGVNHPLYGKTHSLETKAKMSLVKKGENNPRYGIILSPETITKLSKTKRGKYIGENNPFYGKTHSSESLAKMSLAKGSTIYVYSIEDFTLINTFISSRKAAEFFCVSKDTILNYTKNGKLFQDKWILSITPLIKN
jgi:group I intron endonuclease